MCKIFFQTYVVVYRDVVFLTYGVTSTDTFDVLAYHSLNIVIHVRQPYMTQGEGLITTVTCARCFLYMHGAYNYIVP